MFHGSSLGRGIPGVEGKTEVARRIDSGPNGRLQKPGESFSAGVEISVGARRYLRRLRPPRFPRPGCVPRHGDRAVLSSLPRKTSPFAQLSITCCIRLDGALFTVPSGPRRPPAVVDVPAIGLVGPVNFHGQADSSAMGTTQGLLVMTAGHGRPSVGRLRCRVLAGILQRCRQLLRREFSSPTAEIFARPQASSRNADFWGTARRCQVMTARHFPGGSSQDPCLPISFDACRTERLCR